MARKKEKKKGVKIEFLSRSILEGKSFDENLDFIMEKVKSDVILVLEEGLTPEEKKKLIERSVSEIDDNFPGIEFSGFNSNPGIFEKILSVLTGHERKEGLVIVGSSKIMEKVGEEKDMISLLAKLE